MNKKFAEKIASILYPFQLKIEIASVLIAAIGLLLMGSEAGKIILILSLTTLSVLYFFLAFIIDPAQNANYNFFHKLSKLSYSVGILSILFTINSYHGAEMMMTIAFVSIIIGLVGIAILKIRNKENKKFMDADMLRLLFFSITILIFFSFTKLNTNIENTYQESIELPSENTN